MASLSLHEIRTRNSNALHAAQQSALHARFESQPANTQKTYRKPQRDWKVCTSLKPPPPFLPFHLIN
jgi:hypothetical protein